MHVFIELWSVKPSWSALSPASRQQFMANMARLTGPIIEKESIEVLGWGFSDPTVEQAEPHRFFGVWRAARAESLVALRKAIAEGGWYGHFDQVNVTGELLSPDAIVKHHIENDD